MLPGRGTLGAVETKERVVHILDELRWRGVLAQSTDEQALREALSAGPVTLYCGFDPTAPSLHIGNLVQILTLRRMQDAGHRPLGLVGGATGLIGDPKMTDERTLNDPEVVAGWVGRIHRQIAPLLRFDGPNAAQMVNNLDWTAGLSAIDFLRDVGKHYRLGTMLAKETVARRLASEQGISFTEFSYQILQGMDFLELHRRYGCTLQTGGSDQWGNLLSGVELIRKVEGVGAHALATPLITKADGTKFGKTESGTVWLDPEMTTPYAFYQFWLNAADADVIGYLKVFTFRSQEEIAELERARGRAAAGPGGPTCPRDRRDDLGARPAGHGCRRGGESRSVRSRRPGRSRSRNARRRGRRAAPGHGPRRSCRGDRPARRGGSGSGPRSGPACRGRGWACPSTTSASPIPTRPCRPTSSCTGAGQCSVVASAPWRSPSGRRHDGRRRGSDSTERRRITAGQRPDRAAGHARDARDLTRPRGLRTVSPRRPNGRNGQPSGSPLAGRSRRAKTPVGWIGRHGARIVVPGLGKASQTAQRDLTGQGRADNFERLPPDGPDGLEGCASAP